MSQDNVIFLYIFVGFVFFVTKRGELQKYMGYLISTPNTTNTSNVIANAVAGLNGATPALAPGSAIPGAVGPTSVGGPSGPTPLVS